MSSPLGWRSWLGWRPVVGGDLAVPDLERRAEQAVEIEVGRAPVLCSRQSFRSFLAGVAVRGGSDGDAPTTHVVVNDFRHAGLSA